MREHAATLLDWFDDGVPFGLATVVGTSGSTPREVGSALVVGPDGGALGGVSGGCVDGAVYEATAAASTDGAARHLHFGVAGDDPFAIGLTCGGTVDVVVDRIDRISRPHFGTLLRRVLSGASVAEVTVVGNADPAATHLVVTPTDTHGSIGDPALDAAAVAMAREMLAAGVSGTRSCECDGSAARVFVQSVTARPRMIVFGAIDLADAVAQAAVFVGHRVTVCDARPIFATAERFPHADEVVVAWPHVYLTEQWDAGLIDETTAVCVLTHDEKFDEPLLEVAVRTPARYIGVMGSRRTHSDREGRLRARGLDDDDLRRLSSPIGLDLGGRTAAATAISIVAEVLAVSYGRAGARLCETDGPIHREVDLASNRHRRSSEPPAPVDRSRQVRVRSVAD